MASNDSSNVGGKVLRVRSPACDELSFEPDKEDLIEHASGRPPPPSKGTMDHPERKVKYDDRKRNVMGLEKDDLESIRNWDA